MEPRCKRLQIWRASQAPFARAAREQVGSDNLNCGGGSIHSSRRTEGLRSIRNDGCRVSGEITLLRVQIGARASFAPGLAKFEDAQASQEAAAQRPGRTGCAIRLRR